MLDVTGDVNADLRFLNFFFGFNFIDISSLAEFSSKNYKNWLKLSPRHYAQDVLLAEKTIDIDCARQMDQIEVYPMYT